MHGTARVCIFCNNTYLTYQLFQTLEYVSNYFLSAIQGGKNRYRRTSIKAIRIHEYIVILSYQTSDTRFLSRKNESIQIRDCVPTLLFTVELDIELQSSPFSFLATSIWINECIQLNVDRSRLISKDLFLFLRDYSFR